MCVTKSNSGIMINTDVNVKNQLLGGLVKMIICRFLVHVIVSVIKYVKLVFLDNKNCFCKTCLFDKLVLACGDEILNTTSPGHSYATTETMVKDCSYATSLVDKNNYLSHTISLVIICLLLFVVIYISC